MASPIAELYAAGQSVWLDFIRRGLITSGELQRMVEAGWLSGMTSNPTIFRKAIAGSHDYDDAIARTASRGGLSAYEAFLEIGGEDIRLAADVLRPVWDRTEGADGYISFEAQDKSTEEMISEVNRMFAVVGRPNVMIKVPGTPDGVAAVEPLIAEGINVNITLLFDVDVYEQVARAYIAGLGRRFKAGQPLNTVSSVASFFVSRIDTKVDERLPENSPLRGKVAIANAQVAYKRFQELFAGPVWERLASAGARVQRPLWASTSTKNPAYSDVMYVEELVAAHTVNTMPEETMRAFLDHGQVRPNVVEEKIADAEETLRKARDAGIDIKAVTSELLDEGLVKFREDFQKLLEEIGNRTGGQGPVPGEREWGGLLGTVSMDVERRLALMKEEQVPRRIWSYDHTVWKPDPREITMPNRLGWLDLVNMMDEEVPRLEEFARQVAAEGIETVVLMGMGGSSLAPEVLARTFGRAQGMPSLIVLDTSDPDEIADAERGIDLQKTLFIVSSKSGTTTETVSQMAYFWDKLPDGRHFVAITDRGTPLEARARELGFRRVFLNPESIGGRYSALSYFGLVPGALVGADIAGVLDRAHDMLHACHYCLPPEDNPGAWLGAVLGEAALAGRDKVTFILPREIGSFGDWVEQLLAESTGKEGKGIIPVVGEEIGLPEVYGDDRLFVTIGDHPGVEPLERAGQPVVRLPYRDRLQLGSEFFRWEFATAVAGYVLGINPFDQPNVQQAKDATERVLSGQAPTEQQPGSLSELLGAVRAGCYIAIQAYLPRTGAIEERLQNVRMGFRDRHQVATTLGFGPRYLHSTGQVHKGGPDSGLFIQVIGKDEVDLPIPGKAYTFGALKRAQAQGDFETLRSLGRPVVRCTIDELEEVRA